MSTSDYWTRVPGGRECMQLGPYVRQSLMEIKFWGVRGSTPTPQPENMRYGGNTSCVEVRVGEQIYIFDCGTGFRNLGHHLRQEFVDRPIVAHIFVSHFHWDHIQGFPF